jgi:hypothetical protein
MTVVPHPTYFSLFPRLNMKPKVRHSDATELIESFSQAVLNTLTEHDFQDTFNGRRAGNGAYTRMGTTLRVMAASKFKVNFLSDGGTSSANNGWFFCMFTHLASIFAGYYRAWYPCKRGRTLFTDQVKLYELPLERAFTEQLNVIKTHITFCLNFAFGKWFDMSVLGNG